MQKTFAGESVHKTKDPFIINTHVLMCVDMVRNKPWQTSTHKTRTHALVITLFSINTILAFSFTFG